MLEPSDLVSSADLAALRSAHAALSPGLLPAGRPLHGDAHLGNVLWSPAGPLWSDLENACAGPIEYDLACIAWRAAPGSAETLEAYGEHDAGLVAAAEPYLALFLAAWTIVVAASSPSESIRAELRRRIDRASAYAREM